MKAVNVGDVLKILHKYGEYIFVTDEKKYSDMVDEIANLKALEQESCGDAISREMVLDKIKRDIFNACSDNYHMPVYTLGCDKIFEIIDKYKTESNG